MLTAEHRQLAVRYWPHVMKDRNEPFSIRKIGVTVFDRPAESPTFPRFFIDPSRYGWKMLIEYAVYMDYDIQHLYELEHIWIAVGADGAVKDCLCSFHGLCMHAAGIPELYRMKEGKPVLYMQPGKHAFMPDPKLFGLHVMKDSCCNTDAGGGLLIPPMLGDRMTTSPEQNERIRAYMKKHFSFQPAWVFEPVMPPEESAYLSAEELLERIPALVAEQLRIIERDAYEQ